MTQSGTQTAAMPETGLHDIIQHAVHELRQPLGGIESLAYYFELALEDADEELREQCARLRLLVAQAGWMLEDASLAAAAATAMEIAPVDLNSLARELGERLARQEDRSVQLDLDVGAPLAAGPCGLLRRWLDHVLAFLRELPGGEPIPCVETAREGGGVWLRVRCRAGSAECLRSLDPPGQVGGLRRVAEMAGGRFACEVHGAAVSTALWLPAAGHAFD